MLLCGKTDPPLIYNSSFTITSSPSTVFPSILTHRPTKHLHPIMLEESQACDFITAPFKTVHRLMHTPKAYFILKYADYYFLFPFNFTIFYDDVCSNSNIRTNTTTLTNCGRWIDQNVAYRPWSIVEL